MKAHKSVKKWWFCHEYHTPPPVQYDPAPLDPVNNSKLELPNNNINQNLNRKPFQPHILILNPVTLSKEWIEPTWVRHLCYYKGKPNLYFMCPKSIRGLLLNAPF